MNHNSNIALDLSAAAAHPSQAGLFTPIRIGSLTVRNRIIMPAFILGYPFEGREVGEDWLRFYRDRARGGAGLIVVGACFVDPAGRQDEHQLGADCDEWLPSLTRIASAIKENGAVAALQLNHAGRYAKKEINGLDPVAPSAIVSRYTKELPHELSTEEVEEVIASFGSAARRAKQAGFDAIEFLGATGYLISQFLSPLTNQRTDRFGGDEIARRTFVKEMIASVKAAVGEDFPLIFRMSSLDNMPGGMDDNDQLKLAVELEKWGIHLLNVTAGWHDAPVHQIGPSVPQGAFVPYATKIKEAVNIPVSCAMRITLPEFARSVIAEGKLDMVTMGRALIVEPEWAKKVEAGRDESVRPCISCCHCFDCAFARGKIECSLNAALHAPDPTPTADPKRVLVIGGGPAGMEAARVLATRGHRVTLQDKSGKLGGRLSTAAAPPHKSEIGRLIRYQQHELGELNVPVVSEIDLSRLKEDFDAVILATGAGERSLHLEGMHQVPCYTSSQILDGAVTPVGPVVIVGAGLVGGETADFLASKGFHVSLVEVRPKPLADMGASLRWVLMDHLKKGGVKIFTSSSIREIRNGFAQLDTQEGEVQLRVGTLVISVGFQSDGHMVHDLEASGLPFCVIGDKKTPRRIKDAIHEGFWAGTAWIDQAWPLKIS